ncbi:hypothetical protein PSYJA_08213 [Pseudomonas syringae pv. japonica str. M301072]|uniref:Uncharacterized protein n=1 Tax=Pseudomonas syringae pv. japonica str. M301072 TaxID=629262 RepID=F3FFG4_PSESX|nr:hypothetical protein PSYJA_08213 [Pseudomonas syringae pv. japonica str. M301072]
MALFPLMVLFFSDLTLHLTSMSAQAMSVLICVASQVSATVILLPTSILMAIPAFGLLRVEKKQAASFTLATMLRLLS